MLRDMNTISYLDNDYRNIEAVLGYPNLLELLKREYLPELEETKEESLKWIIYDLARAPWTSLSVKYLAGARY